MKGVLQLFSSDNKSEQKDAEVSKISQFFMYVYTILKTLTLSDSQSTLLLCVIRGKPIWLLLDQS
jgi:hypothetical protein